MNKYHIIKVSGAGAETDSDVLSGSIVERVPQGKSAFLTVAGASSITGNTMSIKVGDKELLKTCTIPLRTSMEVSTAENMIFAGEAVQPGEKIICDVVHAGAGYVTLYFMVTVV